MGPEAQMDIERLRAMMGVLFEDNPDGISICDPQGRITTNSVGSALFGPAAVPAPDGVAVQEWSKTYGLFLPDGVTPHPMETLPLVRAMMKQEKVRDYELLCKTPKHPDGLWLSVTASPLGGGYAMAVFRDVTERKQLEKNLAERNLELDRQMRENLELIERLRLSVEELSTPVLELWDDVLALPVIGVVDTVRSSRMMERALAEVVARRCRFVIIDITGVEIVDTSTADRLIRLARAVELLGASCVLSGVQPAVAHTLVTLGVDFRGLTTQRNLKRAIEYCIARKREEAHHVHA